MGIISSIEKQKKNKNRVSIYVDGEFVLGLEEIVLIQERIKIGDEINEQRLKDVAFKSDINTAFNKAIKYLGSRLHSKKEIEKYLFSKEYDNEIVDLVINKLNEYGYINDENFANEFIKSYSKKYGKHYVCMRLKEYGVDRDIIDRLLNYSDNDSLKRVAEKYLSTRKDVSKQKLYGYLYSKGYSSDDILFAIEDLKEIKDYEN
ncbi:MAG: RecX family transcriptional regulator [Firmicutes bacterium]|nr:RecX family transcriptional regulator [Bacillota bacterium]